MCAVQTGVPGCEGVEGWGRCDDGPFECTVLTAPWSGQLIPTVRSPEKAPPTTSMKPTPKTLVLALACLVALLCGNPSLAAELYGRVVGISDGDTITVLDAEQVTHKIRLSGIDAPEKTQPFGERAKQQLSDWVYQATVRVIHDKTDHYDRIVGKVTLNGEDVNIQMIHAGLAWHYKAYVLAKERHPLSFEINTPTSSWSFAYCSSTSKAAASGNSNFLSCTNSNGGLTAK